MALGAWKIASIVTNGHKIKIKLFPDASPLIKCYIIMPVKPLSFSFPDYPTQFIEGPCHRGFLVLVAWRSMIQTIQKAIYACSLHVFFAQGMRQNIGL